MPVITPDILPDAITGKRHRDASAISEASPSVDADAPGSQLPQLVQRLLREKSTNVYGEAMEYMERFVIVQVLQATDGNQSQAAEILGITRGKLRDRINSFNIVLKSDVGVGR